MIRVAFVSIFFISVTLLVFGIVVIIRVDPFYEAQYVIPILGMILGNTLTAVSLGVDKTLQQFSDNRDIIETRICKGATKWEATQDAQVKVRNNSTQKLSLFCYISFCCCHYVLISAGEKIFRVYR